VHRPRVQVTDAGNAAARCGAGRRGPNGTRCCSRCSRARELMPPTRIDGVSRCSTAAGRTACVAARTGRRPPDKRQKFVDKTRRRRPARTRGRPSSPRCPCAPSPGQQPRCRPALWGAGGQGQRRPGASAGERGPSRRGPRTACSPRPAGGAKGGRRSRSRARATAGAALTEFARIGALTGASSTRLRKAGPEAGLVCVTALQARKASWERDRPRRAFGIGPRQIARRHRPRGSSTEFLHQSPTALD